MTAGYAFDVLALCLIVAWLLSIPVAALPPAQGAPDAREREARRRLFLPAVGSLGVVALGFGSALLDARLRTPDHCGATLVHAPALCWLHPLSDTGLSPVEALAALAIAFTGLRALRLLVGWLSARSALSRLNALFPAGRPHEAALLSRLGWKAPALVVDSEEPLCFVHGVRPSRLVVSRGVLEALSEADLASVLAHEAAHVSRGDPFWRPLGRLAALAHFPGLGERAFRRWLVEQETLCDHIAACRVGSPIAMAEALVRFGRVLNRPGRPVPFLPGVAFAALETLEARVQELLWPARTAPWRLLLRPWPWGLLALLCWQAEAVHRSLEGLLRLLHR